MARLNAGGCTRAGWSPGYANRHTLAQKLRSRLARSEDPPPVHRTTSRPSADRRSPTHEVPPSGTGVSACGRSRASKTGRRPNSLASLAGRPPIRSLLAALEVYRRRIRCPSRRTIKKPTRWSPEEWRHIEAAARERGVPPLRYVREAALAARLPPRTRRRGAHELVRQLTRVLNNLHQLERTADEHGAADVLVAVRRVIARADEAVRAASGRPGSTHPLIIAVREAGALLNEVTHRANARDELPPARHLSATLGRVYAAASDVLA